MARSEPTLPNLLIIGAKKAGTTSLHNYLSLHPEIYMSHVKELNFFDEKVRWRLGIDWYKTNFNAAYRVNGESSPLYSRYPRTPGVPERIKQVLGNPKLIYLIRDPVERILSDYVQVADWRPSTSSFDELLPNIQDDSEEYIECSSYFLQISRYLTVFPRENLLVVVLERLKADPKRVLRQIFRFLDVDEDFWTPEFGRRLNIAEDKRYLAPWFNRLAPRAVKRQLQHTTWMPWRVTRRLQRVARWGGAPILKPKLTKEEDLRLQRLLRIDVSALREFLGDELTEWRPYSTE